MSGFVPLSGLACKACCSESGGREGSRTPVQDYFHSRFYTHSLRLSAAGRLSGSTGVAPISVGNPARLSAAPHPGFYLRTITPDYRPSWGRAPRMDRRLGGGQLAVHVAVGSKDGVGFSDGGCHIVGSYCF